MNGIYDELNDMELSREIDVPVRIEPVSRQ